MVKITYNLSKKYEFPGGKIEGDESKETALIREIKEELNIDINIQKEFLSVELQTKDLAVITLFFPIETWSATAACPAMVT